MSLTSEGSVLGRKSIENTSSHLRMYFLGSGEGIKNCTAYNEILVLGPEGEH